MNTSAAFVPALPTLGPAALLPTFTPSRAHAFPLDRLNPNDGRARLYYLARNGIVHGLRALGLREGDPVAMPAYHHGVEVEAVRHAGGAPLFYRIDARMQPDLDDLRRRARAAGARVIYAVHFLGFPQPIAELRAIADELGALLVEDCALALFSRAPDGRWLGDRGDLSIFCLYKTLPVPHGGLALARVPLPPGRSPPLLSTLHHVGGAALARAALGSALGRRLREWVRAATHLTVNRVVRNVQVGTQHLRPEEVDLGASGAVERMLARVDPAVVAARRRHNYFHLYDAIGDDRLCPTGAPPRGVVPLFFPIRVADRHAALAALWSQGIEAIDFWSTGDSLCVEEDFPETAQLRRHVIELPIHQDLDDEAIDLVARAVKNVLAHA